MSFSLDVTDRLLTTTRAVRRRLDLEREVDPKIVRDCLRISQQAPTASNAQGWRWVILADADKRLAIAELYRRARKDYVAKQAERDRRRGNEARPSAEDAQTKRTRASALHLEEHLHEVPVLVIPCLMGRLREGASSMMASGFFGSIYPAMWSLQLALRARGLASAITTLHLEYESEAARILEIPERVTQCALMPVAWSIGQDYRPAERPPVDEILHWNGWGGSLDD